MKYLIRFVRYIEKIKFQKAQKFISNHVDVIR